MAQPPRNLHRTSEELCLLWEGWSLAKECEKRPWQRVRSVKIGNPQNIPEPALIGGTLIVSTIGVASSLLLSSAVAYVSNGKPHVTTLCMTLMGDVAALCLSRQMPLKHWR